MNALEVEGERAHVLHVADERRLDHLDRARRVLRDRHVGVPHGEPSAVDVLRVHGCEENSAA